MTSAVCRASFSRLILFILVGFCVLVAFGVGYTVVDYSREPGRHLRRALAALGARGGVQIRWFRAEAALELEGRPARLEADTAGVRLFVEPPVELPHALRVEPTENRSALASSVSIPDERFTRDLVAYGPEAEMIGVLSSELRRILVSSRLALWPAPWLGIRDGTLVVEVERHDVGRIALVRPYLRDAVAAAGGLALAAPERLLQRVRRREPIAYRVRALKVLLRDFPDSEAGAQALELAKRSKHRELRDAATPLEELEGRLALAAGGDEGRLAVTDGEGGLSPADPS